MKSFGDLNTSVQRAGNPQQAAGTFVDGVLSMIESNVDNPAALREIVKDGRSHRQDLISGLTGGSNK